MKKIYIVLIMICFLIPSCTPEKKKQAGKTEILEMAIPQEKEKTHLIKTITTEEKASRARDDFFKGGFKETNRKKFGVYLVEKGDNVWGIAEKFVKNYLKKKDYHKNDIGDWFYKINLVNFSTNFGGVKDDLRIGEQILIPLN